MAKVVCKGTVLQQEIASVYTAVAQVISLNTAGAESETYDATALDSGVGKEYRPTGYSEGGTMSGEVFYDPALSGHQSMTDLIAAPALQNWKVIFADAGTTSMIVPGGGFGIGMTVAMNDGLKAAFDIKVNGLPAFPT